MTVTCVSFSVLSVGDTPRKISKDMTMNSYISFDWAMKRLLRNKANHAVLEGLMTSLLGRKYTILKFLESESNQVAEDDKFNRVDILAESDRGELTIIEIQNNRELAYFHRMLYGVSKAITEYINLGNDYDCVRKVYSINIVYFELGQGSDYVYHGKTFFRGLHDTNDILKLSVRQNERFFGKSENDVLKCKEAGDLFPEYYVLRVNDFDKVATTPLDEWIEFLKTGIIAPEATAPGLSEARECLRVDSLSPADRQDYIRHMEALRYQRSVLETSHDDGDIGGLGVVDGREDGLLQGRAEGRAEGREEGANQRDRQIVSNLVAMKVPMDYMVQVTGLSEDAIRKIMESL